jgi:uncharacterized protein involved in outer membrane biogenesis
VSMLRWARWLLIGLAVLVALAGAAIFAVTQYFDRERVTSLVAAEVNKATGRQIHFDGPIGFRVLPSLALRLEGVRLANAEGGRQPDMLKAKQLELVVALRPLLSKQLQISRVLLDGVELWLETDAKGQGNWVMKGQPQAPQTPQRQEAGAPMAIDLTQAEIRESTITLRDGKTGRSETLGLQRVSLSSAGPTDRLDAQIRLRDQPLSIKGNIGKLADLLAGADSFPLDLTLTLEGASIKAKGSVGLAAKAGKASFDLDADVRQTTALARLAGRELPLPLPLQLSGRLEQDGARSVLPSFKLTAAGQMLDGKADFEARARRPRLKVTAKAAAIDLGALFPSLLTAHVGTTAPAPKGRLFSDDPLPLTTLPALDANLDLVVAKLELPGKPALSALRAALALNDGRVVVQPLNFRAGSGSVDGAATLRLPTGGAPVLSLRARSAGVTLEEVLAMAGKAGGLSGGRTNVELDLTATGASPRQLAGSLDGELRFKADRMRLSSNLSGLGGNLLIQLVDAVNPFYKQDKGSNLECVAARLTVKRGAIVVDRSIAVESDKLNIVASGSIDLGAETIEMAIRPTVKEGLGLGSANLAQLVKLTGSLSDPRIGVDVKGAARQGLSIGAAVATGGLSLLGERLLAEVVDPHPCVTAMGGKAPATEASQATDKPQKKGFELPRPLRSLRKR